MMAADPHSRGGASGQRVGILTFHCTTNHGASLQALGLVQALREAGHEPEVIDYRPPAAARHYRAQCWKRDRLANWLKYLRFARFASGVLPLSPRRCQSFEDLRREIGSRYQTLVCGSDQIWHIHRGFRPFDPAFYLEFCDDPTVRKVSYAPSFGSPVEVQPHAEAIRAALQKFDALSVRDESSRQWVRDLAGRDATVVADPTLLTDFDVPEPTAGAAPVDLFYGVEGTGIAERALAWSRNRKGTLLCLGHAGPPGSRRRISLGPLEWVREIRRSRMVFTSTFHGTVFAVKFGRPFVAIMRPWNVAKISDFVRRVGLEHRLFDANALPDRLPEDLWDNADVIAGRDGLRDFIQSSQAYLRTALRSPGPAAASILHGRS